MFDIYTSTLDNTGAAQVDEFLRGLGIRFGSADYTVRLMEDTELVGTGSLSGNVLKYIGVSKRIEGEGGCAAIVSALVTEAYRRSITHLFIYTKPENARQFTSLGFYELIRTSDMLMLDNKKDGLRDYLAAIPKRESAGLTGAAVINANPFTNGHLSLCEQAARLCDTLYIFVLSEDRSQFSAKTRYELVKAGTAHIKNAAVIKSGDYIVSYATFPDYFLRDETHAQSARFDLDIALFGGRIAPALNITRRFVGSEPYSPVTEAYNRAMEARLPGYGVELIEFPRTDGISAGRVRELIRNSDLAAIRPLVPDTTYEYIRSHLG